MNLAKNIHAVWTTKTSTDGSAAQKGTFVGTSYERHPKQSEIAKRKEVDLDAHGLRIHLPQLSFIKETTVKISLGDTGRGIVDHYVLLASDDLASPAAAVVVSELPKGMQNHKAAFGAVVQMQEGYAQKAAAKLAVNQRAGIYGLMLEIMVADRCSSPMFPTSNYSVNQSPEDGLDTIGISRFSLVDGERLLVEWSLIVPVKAIRGGLKAKLQVAHDEMESFWDNLSAM